MDHGEEIAVLMGGRSSEREISLKSGGAVLEALRRRGYKAVKVDIGEDADILLSSTYDRAFIALHGCPGEDGTIQGMLEILGIPYTGSGVLASAATMDKVFAKKIMISEGINTPAFEVFREVPEKGNPIRLKLDFPVIVKPAAEGSTVGVTRVDKGEELHGAVEMALGYGDKVLVERFIDGREVAVSVIDGAPLPIVEVVPKNDFYDFEAKYTKGMTEYLVPADIETELSERISLTAVKVYEIFGCRGAARADFIIRDGIPYVLEINTIPGMTETSLLPKAAKAAGIGFDELVERILEGAALDSGKPAKPSCERVAEGLKERLKVIQ